jgi:hypothetical protein
MMRPRTNLFSCLGCTAHAHAARRICADIACASVARLVRAESSAHCFQRRAMWFTNNARTLRCRRMVKPDTFTSLRMRGRRGGRKDPAPHSRKYKRRRQQPRCSCEARTRNQHRCFAQGRNMQNNFANKSTQSHEPASLQWPVRVGCRFRRLFL